MLNDLSSLIKTIPDARVQEVLMEMYKVVEDIREEMNELNEEFTRVTERVDELTDKRRNEITEMYEKKSTASSNFPVGGGSVVG